MIYCEKYEAPKGQVKDQGNRNREGEVRMEPMCGLLLFGKGVERRERKEGRRERRKEGRKERRKEGLEKKR